jgi:hypothetical protein
MVLFLFLNLSFEIPVYLMQANLELNSLPDAMSTLPSQSNAFASSV